MGTLIALLSLVFLLAFVVGLIKPSVVRMPSRKRSSAVYLGGFFILIILGSTFFPTENNSTVDKEDVAVAEEKPAPKSFEYADLKLGEYRNKPEVTRHKMVDSYLEYKEMNSKADDVMYACLSEISFTKSLELGLEEVLGWCYTDYEKNPDSLKDKINLDAFQKNISGWDSSYRPLERYIKSRMNDEDSYKHVSTSYHLILNKDPHARVATVYRGTNGYGAVVKARTIARIDLKTGEVVGIIEE